MTLDAVFIGDSVTYGGGAGGPAGAFPALMAAELGITVVNAGVSGQNTTQMLARFADDVIARHPTYCFILGGTNDSGDGTPIATCENNLKAMCDAAEAAGIVPVLGTVTQLDPATYATRNAYIDQLNTWIRSSGYKVSEQRLALGDYAAGLYFDTTHPNATGQVALGHGVASAYRAITTGRRDAVSITESGRILVSGSPRGVAINTSDGALITGSKFSSTWLGPCSNFAAVSNGYDRYGHYTSFCVDTATGVVRFWFYDREGYAFKCISGTMSGTLPTTAVAAQTKKFHTMRRFGWEATGGELSNCPYEWDSAPVSTSVNPMDLSSFPAYNGGANWGTQNVGEMTSGMFGLPYVSLGAEGAGLYGIGHYVDPSIPGVAWPASYEQEWRYAVPGVTSALTGITITSGQSQPGFFVSTVGGRLGEYEYAAWQGRNLIARTVQTHGKKMYSGFNNNALLGISPSTETTSAVVAWCDAANSEPAYGPHIGAFELDFGSRTAQGYGSLAAGLVTVPTVAQQVTAKGFKPGVWLSPRIDAAVLSNFSGDAYSGPVRWGVGSSSEYLFDPFTAHGIAAIEALAQWAYDNGFKYIRYDVLRYGMAIEAAIFKLFAEKLHSLDPTVVIEVQHPYVQAFGADTVRVNDWWFTTGWREYWLRRLAVCLSSCVYAIVDTDGPAGAWDSQHTFANLKEVARISLAFGRGSWLWFTDEVSRSVLSDSEVSAWFDAYDALDDELPAREIVGNWDASPLAMKVRHTYTDGSTISYDAAASTLEFTGPIGSAEFPVRAIAEEAPAPMDSVTFPVRALWSDPRALTKDPNAVPITLDSSVVNDQITLGGLTVALQKFKRHDTDSPLVLNILNAATGEALNVSTSELFVNIVRESEYQEPAIDGSSDPDDYCGASAGMLPVITGQVDFKTTGADGECRYYWADDDLRFAGVYSAEVEQHKANGRTQTTLGKLYFVVEPDLADDPLSGSMDGHNATITNATLDVAGDTLGTVPVGAVVVAYRDNEPVAMITSTDGTYALEVVAGSTYYVGAIYPGHVGTTKAVTL